MTTDEIKQLELTPNNKIKVVFILAFDETINKPSAVPYGGWMTVGNATNVIILKEARSKSIPYIKQDIGYEICDSRFVEHYTVSNNQLDELFGKNIWEKIWMEMDEFQNWIKDRQLIRDNDADKRQEASWKSTGHR